MSAGLTDLLLDILRRRKATGERTAFLRPEVAQTLFAPVSRGPSPQRRHVAPAAPGPAAPAPARETPVASPAPPARAKPPVRPVASLGWEELTQCIADCRLCGLCRSRTRTVMGDGSRTAELMFIGEGPGRDEDRQGLPFVGAAGQLLDRMITAMQFSRPEVYIANIVKCRPPHNRNPEPAEAEACLPYLYRQIELVSPQVIVLLGAVPLRFLLGKRGIRALRGQWLDFRGIPVMPTYHPAYLLRAPQAKREVWSDLQQVMLRLGKDPAKTPRPGRES